MNRKRRVIVLVALIALLLSTGGATGQEPNSEGAVSMAGTVRSRISYQGRLLEGGAPVTGNRDLRFRLFSDSSCTTQVGTDIVKSGVTVTDGLFSVELDVSHWDLNGQGIWLEVSVGGTAMGCQEILPVPYALSLRPGAVINDADSSLFLNRRRVQPPTNATHKYGVEADVDGSYNLVHGLYGFANNTKSDGAAYGLHGSATAAGGAAYGVYGQSETDSADARGVYGTALYTGVEGHATATSGETQGVLGQTGSNAYPAAGVYGHGGYYGVRGKGSAYGVYGEASATDGGGLYGYHSGNGHGVFGKTLAAGMAGVLGQNDGGGKGVYGLSSTGVGVYAESDSGTGVHAESDDGVGVHAISNSDTALWAETSGGIAAVDARNTAGYGVLASSDSGVGVKAASNSGTALRAETTSGTGVHAESDDGVGVHAISNSDTALWAETSGGIAAVDARNTGLGKGVYAQSAGSGAGGAAVWAQAKHADGIAFWGESDSTDATLVLRNDGTGDLIRGFSRDDWQFRFRVENDGRTTVSVLAITGGSDLSEQFDVTVAEGAVAPGHVVCIDPDHPGKLLVCNGAYDRTVAGVVSGAGGIEPGMVMAQRDSPADGAFPVALAGRVYVRADASAGPIQPGDLLTTSDTAGHAMKASDYGRAQGAIIGKAMSSLEEGQGLILVLVSLQ